MSVNGTTSSPTAAATLPASPRRRFPTSIAVLMAITPGSTCASAKKSTISSLVAHFRRRTTSSSRSGSIAYPPPISIAPIFTNDTSIAPTVGFSAAMFLSPSTPGIIAYPLALDARAYEVERRDRKRESTELIWRHSTAGHGDCGTSKGHQRERSRKATDTPAPMPRHGILVGFLGLGQRDETSLDGINVAAAVRRDRATRSEHEREGEVRCAGNDERRQEDEELVQGARCKHRHGEHARGAPRRQGGRVDPQPSIETPEAHKAELREQPMLHEADGPHWREENESLRNDALGKNVANESAARYMFGVAVVQPAATTARRPVQPSICHVTAPESRLPSPVLRRRAAVAPITPAQVHAKKCPTYMPKRPTQP